MRECCYDECRYAECCYAECHYAEYRYAERRYAECRYAECRAAILSISKVENLAQFSIHYLWFIEYLFLYI
jgi:hypothetical protein